ncbi:hypothetical protein UlMin_009326 [Ulmus minor]
MTSTGAEKELAVDIPPIIRVYKDGSVERLRGSPIVPPSPSDPATGVSSKDITISLNPSISARLYLPNIPPNHQKLPILIYFHGGGFCFESAFSSDHHQFLNTLVSESKTVAVSVEYRLAPEHALPIAYEDSWSALQWVASIGAKTEPWLLNYGDLDRVFIGGDSAGANIVHNLAMRAGKEDIHGGVKITGAFLTHPYFWGSEPIGTEPCSEELGKRLPRLVWDFVFPEAPGGIDNPMVNPVGPEKPSLAGIGCRRLFVSVAEKDKLRDRGVWYCDGVRNSGWDGVVELVEVEGEDHAFQILNRGTEKSNKLIKQLAHFIQK